ncbi:hypothetical protein SPOG_02437 [Schizosaccharomyces cryophilus OY26]|uniref:Uncharacterized protein n=1 Tax=Schizosaccharomyces cryophilus (strain OY26 / ATCC MYA-4695 / CBS 11777 / NBRC 106824 / NRRL Y48691) TaxID=653667 RepID=S9X2D1_SCHCR|nr:uncharacterized protein SPOG_02437 [Schizosaccharomyces cryophilus OY26]EPY51262.1 hypothetical protein SPOG_02437 [Schizosaccharomyces cryophilus OY26]
MIIFLLIPFINMVMAKYADVANLKLSQIDPKLAEYVTIGVEMDPELTLEQASYGVGASCIYPVGDTLYHIDGTGKIWGTKQGVTNFSNCSGNPVDVCRGWDVESAIKEAAASDLDLKDMEEFNQFKIKHLHDAVEAYNSETSN